MKKSNENKILESTKLSRFIKAIWFVSLGFLLGVVFYREMLRRSSFAQTHFSIDNYSTDIILIAILLIFLVPILRSLIRLSQSQLFFLAGLVGLGIGFIIILFIFP